MSPRAEYERKLRVEIPVESGLYKRYIRMEWNFARGAVTRCMVAFEVEVDERVYQVVRFDTDHGGFHQHHPDFPAPSQERIQLPSITPNHWLPYARAKILQHYRDWETIVLSNVVLEIEERSREKGD